MEQRIVFLDLETTGLDPERDEILELGFVIVDKDLTITAADSWLVMPRRLPITTLLNRTVFEMHKASGLLDALMAEWPRASRMHVEQVEGAVLAALTGLDFRPGEVVLGGYSIQFDRSFIAQHMPDLHRFCSHRMIDVSTLRQLWKRWLPTEPPKQETKHRSLEDCLQSIEELRFYRDQLFAQPAPTEVVIADKLDLEALKNVGQTLIAEPIAQTPSHCCYVNFVDPTQHDQSCAEAKKPESGA